MLTLNVKLHLVTQDKYTISVEFQDILKRLQVYMYMYIIRGSTLPELAPFCNYERQYIIFL